MECKSEVNCTCPKVQCPNHGKCCQCVSRHQKTELAVFCMRNHLTKDK